VRPTPLGKLGVTYDIVAHSSNGVRYRFAPRWADYVSTNGPRLGDPVRIYCYTTGDSVFGNSSWAKVAENPDRYVPAYYLRYGHVVRPASVKPCPPTPVGNLPGPSGLLYRVTGTVTIYSGPTAASTPLGKIPKDTMIGVQCKRNGPTVYGPYPPSSNWDRVSFEGITGFVTDEWVDTKTDERDRTKVPPCP
jgi:hypothetical protein